MWSQVPAEVDHYSAMFVGLWLFLVVSALAIMQRGLLFVAVESHVLMGVQQDFNIDFITTLYLFLWPHLVRQPVFNWP